jgi:glycerophosphoryl diester phosphodiesterase
VSLPLRLAHRGDWRQAPENSVAAMQAALRNPACDGLEFDVRSSADGVPVLVHDTALLRVQSRPEYVDALTATELTGAGVSRLDEVLELVDPATFLDIEIKGALHAKTVDAIDRCRTTNGVLNKAAISSFRRSALLRLGDLRPDWDRWLNSHDLKPDTIEKARDLGCRAISAEWHAINEEAMGRASAAGLQVVAWTVRERSTFDRLAELGVAAMCVEAEALDG